MAQVVEFGLEDGGTLIVQAAGPDSGGGLGLASPDENLRKAGETLESAVDRVVPALESVTGKLKKLSPNGMKVEFGLTLSAESGVILAKAGGEVHLNVTLNWGPGNESD
ncbi:MAG: hypothetical protein FWE35_07100 [Streptosporangiales bacterium]|jgi:hypothetical protein|nr:hypothetical protein [Streptosporangiales bacterium]